VYAFPQKQKLKHHQAKSFSFLPLALVFPLLAGGKKLDFEQPG